MILPGLKHLTRTSSVIGLSSLNFLFFILITKNIAYQFLVAPRMEVSVLFVLLKLSFAGFSLGLLLAEFLKKKFPRINIQNTLHVLSYALLLSGLINFCNCPSGLKAYIIAFAVIFIPSFLFGLAYSLLIKWLRLQYHKAMFFLLLGTTLAIPIYYYLLIYLPFITQYFVFFLLLQSFLLLMPGDKLKYLPLLFFAVIYIGLSRMPNFGQAYTYPLFQRGEKVVYLASNFGPHGVLDVLYSFATKRYLTFSDKGSPSHIAIKGDINGVDEDAKIPYLLKSYEKSLIIGIGGGQDIVAGLYYNTNSITAVDIDMQRIRLMQGMFKSYSHELFFDSRVTVINASARDFLRKNKQRYDLIFIHRPWTGKHINSLFYEPSRELFTEEALDSYMSALNNGGIIYWGVPVSGPKSKWIFAVTTLKNNMQRLTQDILIFYQYSSYKLLSVMIGPRDDLERFHKDYRNKYEFVYYPSMNVAEEGNDMTHFLFSKDKIQSLSTDKQLFGTFRPQPIVNNLIIFTVVLLLLSALNRFLFKEFNYAGYFLLGIGYDLTLFFSIMWISLRMFNTVLLYPILCSVYFLLGSMGYLHSGRFQKSGVIALGFALLFSLFLVFGISVSSLWRSSGIILTLTIAALFIFVGYAITFPFGYLIRHEKRFSLALATDYLGSLFSFCAIFAMPHLDFLLVFIIVLYALILINLAA